jgi:REP element-mobilizing transposase RayT
MQANIENRERRSIRLQGYNYSGEGRYFITIVLHERMPLFGRLEKSKMILSEAGQYAHDCWLKIPEHYPHVILHEFIIMHDHVHGIIELKKREETDSTSTSPIRKNTFTKIIPGSIGSIIRSYKAAVTTWVKIHHRLPEVWQRNYYEMIIKDDDAYQKICAYIRNNPIKHSR